ILPLKGLSSVGVTPLRAICTRAPAGNIVMAPGAPVKSMRQTCRARRSVDTGSFRSTRPLGSLTGSTTSFPGRRVATTRPEAAIEGLALADRAKRVVVDGDDDDRGGGRALPKEEKRVERACFPSREDADVGERGHSHADDAAEQQRSGDAPGGARRQAMHQEPGERARSRIACARRSCGGGAAARAATIRMRPSIRGVIVWRVSIARKTSAARSGPLSAPTTTRAVRNAVWPSPPCAT